MGQQFRLDFSPSTYWPESSGTRAAVAKIKGTARRAAVLRSLVEGSPSPPDALLTPSLPEEVRAQLGALHPAFMGGEYLPEFEPDEVEIARVDLASVTADVIAVLARRAGTEITYRVVDEYETDYVCAPERSREPLTLGELVGLLDQTAQPDAHPAGAAYGLIEGQWEWHLRAGNEAPEHAAKFVSVSSAYYPALSEYYAARADEWILMSKRNPLSQQSVAALENAWRRSPEEKRRLVFEFLRSHGYQRGWFRKYGARHHDFVLSLLVRCWSETSTSPTASAPCAQRTARARRSVPLTSTMRS